eukprot:Awhi_evm1s10227
MKGTNIAVRGIVSQSSELDAIRFPPSNLIDGSTIGVEHGTIATKAEEKNWVEIDFKSVYSIRHVKITNRLDCCEDRIEGFVATLYNLDSESQPIEVGRFDYSDFNAILDVYSHTFFTAVDARYIKVETNNGKPLNLLEIEVHVAI